MKQLEQWTNKKCSEVIFDSNIHDWSQRTLFDNTVHNKSNLAFIVEDTSNNKFGGYIVSTINAHTTNDINDSNAFIFSLKSNGRINGMKRFNITSITRDREYDVTQGNPGSRIVYFTVNPNGEAEVIKVTHKPNPKLKKISFEKDFSEIGIKGRQSMGNILTKNDVHKIVLKQRGGSTLGGRKVWFDPDVLRLNYDERGQYLGEFHSDDLILVIMENGEFYTTNFDLNNHYETGIRIIEKFDANKVWSVALYDADQQGYPYLKRFTFEATNKKLNFLGENKQNQLILMTDVVYPRIGVKSYKAKGKRITTFKVNAITELMPLRFPEPEEPTEEVEEPVNEDPDNGKSDSDIIDELTGQMKLF